MKIQLEIDYEIDGTEPNHQDVIDALSTLLTRCILSEEIGKPDEWALMPKECSIHILPNPGSQTQPENKL
jgi:hypothetical protein